MSKTVKRLKLMNSDTKILPKAFDHWRKWIQIKRLMTYHLRYCNNAVEDVKCDIRWAFEKWRRGDSEMAAYLDQQDFSTLADKNRR